MADQPPGPALRGDEAVTTVRGVLARPPADVVPVGQGIAIRAATLGAEQGSLRLPHVLVIASADSHRADRLVTTAPRWPPTKAVGISVRIARL